MGKGAKKPLEKGQLFKYGRQAKGRLLLSKAEINKLRGKTEAKGYTVVPTRAYFKKGLVKVEVGLAKGTEGHDKRRAIADRDAKRDIARTLQQYNTR